MHELAWPKAHHILIAAGFATSLLAGCGTTGLSNQVRPYVGKDYHELKARLGDPGQREASGDRIFVWSSDSQSVLAENAFGTSTGNGGGVSYAGSSTRAGLIPVQFQCTLEVTVDAKDIVRSYEIEGSTAGCAHLRQALNH